MNEFGRVRLHPHWHGLVAVYGDFFPCYIPGCGGFVCNRYKRWVEL